MEMSTKSLENMEKSKDESFRRLELAVSILELFSLDYVLCCTLDVLQFCLQSVWVFFLYREKVYVIENLLLQ